MILLTPPTEVHGAATDRTLAKLTQRHLTDLRASGLSDQQIARCGFHSLQAPARIQAALRWHRYKGELGDCLAFLFVDAEGKATGYIRLKPDRPRKSKDGKPIKYESPKGAGNRAFFPPGTLAALKDSSIPLVLTEGEKKAAKADQEGFSCIGDRRQPSMHFSDNQKSRAKDGAVTMTSAVPSRGGGAWRSGAGRAQRSPAERSQAPPPAPSWTCCHGRRHLPRLR